MHIQKCNWCDFVVWTPRSDDCVQEQIHYNKDFRKDKMIPKPTKFYLYTVPLKRNVALARTSRFARD